MAVALSEAAARPSGSVETSSRPSHPASHIEMMFPEPLVVPQLVAIDSQVIPKAKSAMTGGKSMLYRFANEDRSLLIHRIVDGATVPTADEVMGEVEKDRLLEQMRIVGQLDGERKESLKRALGDPSSSDHLLSLELQGGFAQEFGRHLFDEYRMAGLSLHPTADAFKMPDAHPTQLAQQHAALHGHTQRTSSVLGSQDMVAGLYQALFDVEDKNEQIRKMRGSQLSLSSYGSSSDDIAEQLQKDFVAREAVRFGDRPIQPLPEPIDIFVSKSSPSDS